MSPAPWIAAWAALGLAVTVAHQRRHGEWSLLAGALWPFFLPGLLPGEVPTRPVDAACAELAEALLALGRPGGEDLQAVAATLRALQARRDELERLLSDWTDGSEAQRAARQELEAVWERTDQQLARGLSAVHEITARLHVARLTGEAPAGLEERLRGLRAHVDSASELRRIGA